MRKFLSIAIPVGLTALLGIALCRAMSRDARLIEMSFAAGIILFASIVAIVPLILARSERQLAVVQAALIGSVAHMLATLLLGGALILFQVVAPRPLLFWLLAFYWVSLAALVVVFVRTIQHAPPYAAATPAPHLG